MIAAILVCILIAMIALALIIAGTAGDQRARRVRSLTVENAHLRSLVRKVEIEARAQLGAGNASFEHVLTLIGEHREKESE